MWGYFANSTRQSRQLVETLCATAIKGLNDCYLPGSSLSRDGFAKAKSRLNSPLNLRYMIIAQAGIKRWLRYYGNTRVSLPNLWGHIWSNQREITGAGDLGLAILAGVESEQSVCAEFVERLINNWQKFSSCCNAVELAWVVQGLVAFSRFNGNANKSARVLKDAHRRLMALSCPQSGLFARHSREGLAETMGRKVSCFADQVYPIMALAEFGEYFEDRASIYTALSAADAVCQLQGSRGQWWWHYDSANAKVVEEYPVFSVHQDAMAPMALLAIDKVAGTDHSFYIEKALAWLNENNELGQKMILPEDGIILRDIHRREIHKSYRFLRGLFAAGGFDRAHRLTGKNLFGYVLNKQCRPYHLGWILYAWAGRIGQIDRFSTANAGREKVNSPLKEKLK